MNRKEWFADIEIKILDTEKNDVFKEVKQTFLANLDRACYIMCWICLIESLKMKIKELSQLDNAAALEIEKEILEKENLGHSVDKFIIESVEKLLIVEKQDIQTLNFLWSQRCLFAHPYHIKPNETEIKFIIDKMVEISLSKELIFNNASLEEIINNIISKPYFLSNDNNVIKYYIDNILKRTKPNSYHFIFKTILFKLGTLLEDQKNNKTSKKLIILTRSIVNKSQTPIDVKQWGLEFRLTKWPYPTIMAILTPQIWPKIDIRNKDLIVNYFSELDSSNEEIKELLHSFSNLLKSGYLEDHYYTKIIKKFNKIDFSSIIQYYPSDKEKFTRILDQLSEPNFVDQNPCINILNDESIINIINNENDDNQLKLATNILYLANSSNYKAISYINNISKKYSAKYQEQLLIACFISRTLNKYSIKGKIFIKLLDKFKEFDWNEDVVKSYISKIDDTVSEYSLDSFKKLLDKENFDDKTTSLVESIIEILEQKKSPPLIIDL